MKLRVVSVLICITIILISIGFIFWRAEFVYSLPTPVPKNYVAVDRGNKIYVPASIHCLNRKPVFLHFFNPDCPCSKFNIRHFKALQKQYSNDAKFIIVVLSKKKFTAKEIQVKFDLDIPVLFDASLAIYCGVYSTPQAVIIDKDQNLYYRGNYNRSRYCTDKKTNYAQQALENLLQDKHTIIFNQFAIQAYGCGLPDGMSK